MENPKMLYSNSLDFLARVYCAYCWLDHWFDLIADTRIYDSKDDMLYFNFNSHYSDSVIRRTKEAVDGYPMNMNILGEVFLDVDQINNLLKLTERVGDLSNRKENFLPEPTTFMNDSDFLTSKKVLNNDFGEKIIIDIDMLRRKEELQLLDVVIGWHFSPKRTIDKLRLSWKHIKNPKYISENTVTLNYMKSIEFLETLRLLSNNIKTSKSGLVIIDNREKIFEDGFNV
jgi:hypothetical protein